MVATSQHLKALLNLIACGMILWDGIILSKTIYHMRDRLKAWVYWLALEV